MRLSREKINHIAKLVVEDLERDDRIKLLRAANEARIHVFRIIMEQLQVEDQIDGAVRRTLNSYSKKLVEGSHEWDIMYSKLFDEELSKRKL